MSSPEDIPKGQVFNIIKGSPNAFRDALSEMKQTLTTGYLKIMLKKENKHSDGYLFFKNGMLIGVAYFRRNLLTNEIESHFGEKCLAYIKENSNEKTGIIESHSGVDMDKVLQKYPGSKIGKVMKIPEKSHEPVLKPLKKEIIEDRETIVKQKKSVPKSKLKIGLVWGPDEGEEEKDLLRKKLDVWKSKNYIVSKLEKLLEKDVESTRETFQAYEELINKLEQFKIELNTLATKGFESDVKALRTKLNDPEKIMEIELEIRSLRELAARKEKLPRIEKEFEILKEEEKKAEISELSKPLLEQPEFKALRKIEKIDRVAKAQVKVGRSYLIKENRPTQSVRLFIATTAQGFKGLFITRANPKKIRSDFDLKSADLLWLTDTETTEPSVPPSLEILMHRIEEFLIKSEKTVLFLDGIEYLIGNNNFDAVLRFLRRLIDTVSETETVFFLSVSPQTLKEQELKIIEREMELLTS